ncbi:mediator of DNA damage checkpoint protein 1 isoform X2 [Arvicanthis niloticus]|uniref:mediator of DNA damage checkpoint protein 1 isoform X2 n=1 Tax=Arvicanthis niloticus TaxID=61156 RepID=UPI001485DA94|nr:mediator of DNA damage checkpoint protein 1 isoform X2 [Arvicanthis niloticus]
MENTQVIDWDAEQEEEAEISSGSLGYSVEPIGRLRLFSGTHGPEKDFPLYLGKNVVGRSPDCSVALPFPSISKQHAVIEISAWNKAPILQDCGSLNGTQIVKPPRVLPPGVTHRLRDQELILFADFPCQYHRLDIPPPLVPRSLLTIEKTPRIRGGSQNSRVLLAEDSEEEGDFPSGRCVVNGSRNTASPSVTVVPESDEEGSSPAPSVPGPSSPFGLGSDTDEEQGQQPGVEEFSLADRNGAAGEAEQPEANGMTAGIQAQPTEQKLKDTKVKKEAGSSGVPVGSVLERSPTLGEDGDTEVDEEHQPSGSVDSDTDVEEEKIPVTSSVVPVENQVLLGVGIGDPGAPGVAHLQDSPAGSDTDVEEDKTTLAVPLERNHTPMVINSDTDEEEEEVSAALTLAHLKERGIALWSRDPGTEEVKSQPQVLVERSQSASGRDSDTDMEEGSSGGKRKIVPDSPMDVDEALTVTQPESQPPDRPSDIDGDVEMSSPDSRLAVQRASSAGVDKNGAQVEEDIPGPSFTPEEKHQVPLEGGQPPEEAWETAAQEGFSPMDVGRLSQQPVAEAAGTECAAAVSEQESTLEVGAQSRSPAAPVEQVVVYTDTSGDPTLPRREGAQIPTGRGRDAHVDRTKSAKECYVEPENLCLSATQCFVEGESQHPEAVQSLEDEPTQVFPCTLLQEPGPSHLSLPTPGADTLDVPWEVLATQPFCLREQTETSGPQLIDTHLEDGSQPSLPREPPEHQHLVHTSPVHTELLKIEGREIQTVEKAMGITKEIADRVAREREPLEREIRGRTANSDREDVIGEELTQGTEDRESKKVLARDSQRKEADKDPEGNRESLQVEMEMSKDSQKKERKVEKSEPEREWEPGDSEVTPDRGLTEEGSHHDQKGQTASLTLKPGVGVKDLEGLASAPIMSGSQGDGGKGDPLSPRRQQRGHLSCQMTPARKASRGDPEPPDHCLFSPVPEASAQSLLTSQSQKQSTPQPLFSTSSSELPLPETLLTKPNVRPRRSSRMTPSPHSSVALKPYTTCPTNQPAASRPTSRPTRSRANRSSTRTPELIAPTDPEPSTSIEQPIIPKLTSQVTEGRAHSTSVKMPEPVLTVPEIQSPTTTEQSVTPDLKPWAKTRPSRSPNKTPEPLTSGLKLEPPTSTEQPVIPKPTSRVTRGRPRKSSVRTPEPVVPIGLELQPLTSTEQPVICKPRATRGKSSKSSIKTLEPVVPTGPELQPLTSAEQPVIPKPRATRGKSSKSSTKTPEPVVPTGPELQSLTSAEHPVVPNLTSLSSQGRSSKSIRTPEPVVQTGPEFHPSTSKQPDNPEPSSQGRTCRSSVRSPESSVSTTPELQSLTSKKQPTPKTTALVTRGRKYKPSTEDSESVGPVAPDFEPPISTDHLVTPKITAQPVTLEPIPQTNHQRRRRATGKQGSCTVPVGHKSYSAPSEPESQSSASQSSESSEVDSSRQKRPRRQVSQKTIVVKEEDLAEIEVKEEPQETAIPTPGKRKRDRAEEETQGNPTRSRRTKPNQEAVAPKVLFTGVVDSRGERAVLALGGTLASSVNEASHLVTDRIRRTVKFLCALGKGIPILSLNWLYQSRKAGCFLPPDDYLVTDPEQEKNFNFSLRDSLSRARERRLLEDYEIHVTPGVQPPPPQMGEIINCCGGTVLPSMPHSYKLHRVVITCTEDLPRCAIPSRLGLPLLSPEFLLTGVLKQEATPEAFILSNLEMST